MGHRWRRDRRDHGSNILVGIIIAVAAVTAVISELQSARDVFRRDSGLGCCCVHLDHVIFVSGMHFTPRPT
jgi:hypothetical protein